MAFHVRLFEYRVVKRRVAFVLVEINNIQVVVAAKYCVVTVDFPPHWRAWAVLIDLVAVEILLVVSFVSKILLIGLHSGRSVGPVVDIAHSEMADLLVHDASFRQLVPITIVQVRKYWG